MEPSEFSDCLLPTFMPTNRQIAARLLLHRSAAAQTIANLTPSNLSTVLGKLMGEHLVSDIMVWIRQDPSFFYWITEPDQVEVSLYKARQKAAKVVEDILDMDAEGDAKMMSIKYAAAKDLLQATTPPAPQVVKNTVNVRAANANVPKHLASKSVEELEQLARTLQSPQ